MLETETVEGQERARSQYERVMPGRAAILVSHDKMKTSALTMAPYLCLTMPSIPLCLLTGVRARSGRKGRINLRHNRSSGMVLVYNLIDPEPSKDQIHEYGCTTTMRT